MSYRIVFLITLVSATQLSPVAKADSAVAYTGAKIETVSKAGTIESGTIVVRDGKIESVGNDVEIPLDAKRVDVSGHTVMPALVNIYHPVTISGISSGTPDRVVVIRGRTFRIPGRSSTSAPTYSKISDNLDPRSLKSDFTRQARYGVGFVNVVTRGYGQSVHAKVLPDDVDGSITNTDGGLFLAVTNSTASLDVLRNGLRGGTSRGSSSRTRSGSSATTSSSARTTSSTASSGSATSGTSLTSLWQSVKEGKTPIVLNANNAATIMYLLQIKKEYAKAKFILVASGENIYRVLDDLKGTGISVILRAEIDTAPRSRDRINVPKQLEAAGIPFGFSPSLDSSLETMPDTPYFPVALLVKTGLSRTAALEALTIAPAKMLGIEKTVGSIEPGKQANLVFLDGDPLAAASSVQRVLVEGNPVYED